MKKEKNGIENLRKENKRNNRIENLIVYGLLAVVIIGLFAFGAHKYQVEKELEAKKQLEYELEQKAAEERKLAEAKKAAEKEELQKKEQQKEKEEKKAKAAEKEKLEQLATQQSAVKPSAPEKKLEKKKETKEVVEKKAIQVNTSKENVTEKAKIVDNFKSDVKINVSKPQISKEDIMEENKVQKEKEAKQPELQKSQQSNANLAVELGIATEEEANEPYEFDPSKVKMADESYGKPGEGDKF